MIILAEEVDVPAAHVTQGRTKPGDNRGENQGDKVNSQQGRLIDIKYSREKPENAFTSVNYNSHRFWRL